VLHLLAALDGFRLAMSVEAGLVQGRLMQNSWNLAFVSLVAIGVAAFMNWRNSQTGYWINLVAVALADIGFIIFILVPGLIPLWPAMLGPVLWLLAALFSTLGLRSALKGG
jgi:hypothetical protein